MDILDEVATEEALRRLPGWERTGDAVAKTFVHDSSNIVTVAIPTHDANGLTRADIVLAHRIEALVGAHEHPPGLGGLA